MRAVVASILIASMPAVLAQSQESRSFETVSLERSRVSGVGSRMGPTPDGGYEAVGAPLSVLIGYAYSTNPANILALPGWARFETYDVVLVPRLAAADSRAMMRTLLSERFKLAAHTEERGTRRVLVIDRLQGSVDPDTRRVSLPRHPEVPIES